MRPSCADYIRAASASSLVAPLAVLGAFVPVPAAQGLSDDILARVLDHMPEVEAPEGEVRSLVDHDDDDSTLADLTGSSSTTAHAPSDDAFDVDDVFEVDLEPEV